MTELASTPFSSGRRIRRRHMTVGSIVLTIILALITAYNDPDLRKIVVQAQPGMYTVTHVNDGDTIIVRQADGREETVRLLGVDTPEVKDPRKPVQCFGAAASAHTKAVITIGSGVRLAPDPQDTDRDKYGRLLRYVYLPDGTLYNAQLIRDGYGFAYTVFPLTKLDEFKALEVEARTNNRGLWGGCKIDESSKVKQTAGNK